MKGKMIKRRTKIKANKKEKGKKMTTLLTSKKIQMKKRKTTQ